MNILTLIVMLNVIDCIIYVSGSQGSNTNKESVEPDIHTKHNCDNGLINDGFMIRNADGSLSCINGWKNKALKDDNYSVYGKLLVKAYTNGN
eukprot:XP_016661490.1 PREDICTED: uncharacterized protein LOC103309964 [Acyrthosiphon pisum]